MSCLDCGCPDERHRHYNRGTYCGKCEHCNRYKPRRERWWQIWRKT